MAKSRAKSSSKKSFGQVGARGKTILAFLVDQAHPFVEVDRPWARLRYGDDLEREDAYWEKVERKRAIERLRKKKWLKQQRRGRKMILELTTEGKVFALGQRIITSSKSLPKGVSCLVSFDIPENARSARNTLRHLFKAAEFRCLHQSAWVTEVDVVVDLREIVDILKIQDWVTIFVGEIK